LGNPFLEPIANLKGTQWEQGENEKKNPFPPKLKRIKSKAP
jgi:hypothetical protein